MKTKNEGKLLLSKVSECEYRACGFFLVKEWQIFIIQYIYKNISFFQLIQIHCWLLFHTMKNI